jgi:predicted membrane-bound spermidine synthase
VPLIVSSLAFFLSGFAALVYQILWQRLLVLPIGADVYSTTVIVAAFMTGLGGGSLAGGYVADRLAPRRSLAAFVVAELAIGLFGFASRAVFYDGLYLRLGSGGSLGPVLTAVLVFAGLMWPTLWMGMSLPLLARAVNEHLGGAARRVGVLYGLNTLGAATGAAVTTWLLLPTIGIDGGIRVAAFVNVLAALSVTPLVVVAVRQPAPRDAKIPEAGGADPRAWPFSRWAALYAVAGFQALSLEIVWFRLLGVMVKSSAFTFGTLLTVYLAGLGIGAALASVALRSVRQPALAFLLLQSFVGLYAGLSVAALTAAVDDPAVAPTLHAYFREYEPLGAAAAFAELWKADGNRAMQVLFTRLYVWLPLVLIGPPTVAMGACFPLLQKVVLTDLQHIGRRVGGVLIANIAGSAAGAVLTGWLALTWLGTVGTLRALTALSALFLTLLLARTTQPRSTRRSAGIAAVVLIVGAATWAVPGSRLLWSRLHGAPPAWIVYAEDATGLSLIKDEGRATARGVVFVSGIGQSWIPYGAIHTVLGALPAFLHPAPRDAAIIGLGSGDTLYAVAGRRELSRIVSVEIVAAQLKTLEGWFERSGYTPLDTILRDQRIEHVAGDGRMYIMRSQRAFDLIEADALRPTSAYAGHLYSTRYFELLRSKLTPDGYAVTWLPTPRVLDTFTGVFPHALNFGDFLIGSNAPIPFDPEAVRARLQSADVQEHFERAGIDIDALLAPYLSRRPQVITGRTAAGDAARAGAADVNEDLFPRDEFSVPRAQ